MTKLNIGKDFSPDPSGRYKSDGDGSGEAFREDCLLPAIKKLSAGEKLQIIIDDGVEGYGSSFLVEGFAGVVKYGYIQKKDLLDKIEIICSDEDFEFYKKKIIDYINQAKFDSQEYIPGSNKE